MSFHWPLNRQQLRALSRAATHAFTHQRPLRVLFLGQINVRKGALPLFDAVKRLSGEPVEFWFVGPLQVDIPHELRNRIKWFGIAARHDVSRYYRDADVFIMPTFSDGFGLTQLEAQSWKLPVIASRNCGDVVTDGSTECFSKKSRAKPSQTRCFNCCVRPPHST